MRQLVMVPEGWPCTLAECRPGHFVFDGQHLGFKSEYQTSTGRIEAFNEAGEYFYPPNGDVTMVQPRSPRMERRIMSYDERDAPADRPDYGRLLYGRCDRCGCGLEEHGKLCGELSLCDACFRATKQDRALAEVDHLAGTREIVGGAMEGYNDRRFDRLYERAMNPIDARVEAAWLAAGHKKVRVQYSSYETDADDVPIDNLDQPATHWESANVKGGERRDVPIAGRCVLYRPANDYFGGPRSKDYVSDVLANPTWLEVAVCANAAIRRTRDRHHVFLEGLEYCGDEGGVPVYEIVMGS